MGAPRESPPLFLRIQFEKVLLWMLASPLRITTAVVLFGAAASLIESVVHLAVVTSSAPTVSQAVANSLILGIVAASFGLLVLTAAQDRHHKMRDDLRRIAELNHQVRNALQIIVYGEHCEDLAEHRSIVLESVQKIEGTLRELFPLVGERKDDRPWEAHNRVRLQGHNFRYERRRQAK